HNAARGGRGSHGGGVGAGRAFGHELSSNSNSCHPLGAALEARQAPLSPVVLLRTLPAGPRAVTSAATAPPEPGMKPPLSARAWTATMWAPSSVGSGKRSMVPQ